MSRSAIYIANISSQNVLENGVITLGTIIRRFGPNLNLAGNAIQVAGSGYYDLTATVTLEPAAAGTATIKILKDNVEVQGATASATVAETDTSITLPINCLIRENCPCCDTLSNITFVLEGVGAEITNVAIVVEKI